MHGTHLIVAAELQGYGVAAILVRLDADSNPTDSRLLLPVNPDQQGIDYFDLGPLTPGRYVVAVGSLAQTADPATPSSPAYAWASSIAALVVTVGGD